MQNTSGRCLPLSQKAETQIFGPKEIIIIINKNKIRTNNNFLNLKIQRESIWRMKALSDQENLCIDKKFLIQESTV